jgi:hypothetical protein
MLRHVPLAHVDGTEGGGCRASDVITEPSQLQASSSRHYLVSFPTWPDYFEGLGRTEAGQMWVKNIFY